MDKRASLIFEKMNEVSLLMLSPTDVNVFKVQISSPLVSTRRSCLRIPSLGDDDLHDEFASLFDVTTTPFSDAVSISCVVDLELLMDGRRTFSVLTIAG